MISASCYLIITPSTKTTSGKNDFCTSWHGARYLSFLEALCASNTICGRQRPLPSPSPKIQKQRCLSRALMQLMHWAHLPPWVCTFFLLVVCCAPLRVSGPLRRSSHTRQRRHRGAGASYHPSCTYCVRDGARLPTAITPDGKATGEKSETEGQVIAEIDWREDRLTPGEFVSPPPFIRKKAPKNRQQCMLRGTHPPPPLFQKETLS